MRYQISNISSLQDMDFNIAITDAAILFFKKILEQELEGTNIRITVTAPGSIYADVKVAFCPPKHEEISDIKLQFDDFAVFIEQHAISYLKDAKIDHVVQEEDELLIKAPHLRDASAMSNDDQSLTEKIQLVIEHEINPLLASHGGMIALDKVVDDTVVFLRFGGGCLGCSMANATFQNIVEEILKQHFPCLKEIRNVTDLDNIEIN